MNMIEQLLQADKSILDKKAIGTVKSERLSRLMGKDAVVKIQEINGRRIREIAEAATTNYDAELIYCVEGMTDPSLKDKDLMKYYDAATPKDLAERLLSIEAGDIARAIVDLSTSRKLTENDVKN